MNDKDEIPTQTPWPIAGDTLFREGSGAWENGRLDWGHDRWEIYATGYKSAADILAERCLERQFPADLLIYPIGFLYRHYLELRLKELVISGQQLLDEPPDLQHVHRLDVLWISSRKILERVWPEGSVMDLDAVQACITELCQVDPQSVSFRYPITRDAIPTLAGMGKVSITNLRDVMGRISALLEGSSMAISEYLDSKRALESDYCR